MVRGAEQVWAYLLTPSCVPVHWVYPSGREDSLPPPPGGGTGPDFCLCLCAKQHFRVPTLFGCDWEERPPRSELEGCYVVGLLCSTWIVHNKHHVQASGCPYVHLAPGHPRPQFDDRLCGCIVDFRPYVLDTRVKRGAELSTDHHLVVSWLRWWGRMQIRPGRPKPIVRV